MPSQPMNFIASPYALVPFIFSAPQVAIDATALALATLTTPAASGSLAVAVYVMPFDGGIVAVTSSFSAAVTTSTATIKARKNGTALTRLNLAYSGSGTHKRSSQDADLDQFVAGDTIGAEITTSHTFAPTTLDLVVIVWVQFKGLRF